MKSLILVIALLTIPVSLAQQPSTRMRTIPRPEPVLEGYSKSEIDSMVVRLPERFRGVDPEIVYKALEQRAKRSKKDEFETTQEFEARVAKEQQLPLIGTLNDRSLFAFTLVSGASAFDKVQSVYDADKGTLRVAIEIATPFVGITIDSDQRSTTLKYAPQPSTTYIGQNAYGTKVEIEKRFMYVYELIVDNFHDFAFDSSSYRNKMSVTIKMDPASARLAKPNIRVLALGNLVHPYYVQGFLSHKPTITEPTESLTAFQHLIVRVREFWVYNYETGQFYAKIKPGDGPRTTPPGTNPIIP